MALKWSVAAAAVAIVVLKAVAPESPAPAGGRQGMAPPLIHIHYEPGHHGDSAFLRAVRQGKASA